MILALLSLLAAAPTRPFPDERQLLDRRLETLRRILPDGPNPQADSALVKEMADTARLTRTEIAVRPPAEAGARGDVILDFKAFGRLPEIDRFFRAVALSYRIIDVESLALTATPENVARLAAVVRLPYRPLKAGLPAPPDGTRSQYSRLPKPILDAYVHDQSLALAKVDAIASLRRSRRNPRLFLSELAAVVRDRPVVLTSATLNDEFRIRGVTVGEGPARTLESRFERGFFRVSEFLMARQGACRQFEVRGRSPVAGVDAELPLPTEDAFATGDTPCRVDRDTGRLVVVKTPARKTAGTGPLSLRLREVDIADLFMVLHRLTGQAFLVDGDVAGRVSVDMSHATLDEALALLQKGLEVRVSEAGAIRRVASGRGPALKPPPQVAGGPSGRFTLKRAEVRDILAAMTEADPGLGAVGPQGFLGRLSLWTGDLTVSAIRGAVLEAAGLTEKVEEGRRILERRGGGDDALVPVAGAPPEPRLVLRLQDLCVSEFDPVGVAANGDQWLALAYAPSGALDAYKAGDRLCDAVVKTVESTDILLDTEEGPLRLALPPIS